MEGTGKVFDFSTGRRMIGIKNTNRKTFHVMVDGSMVSYHLKPSKMERIKGRCKQFFNYLFEV